MQKLQIFAYKSTQGQTTFGVLRNPHHVAVLGLEDGQELAILSPPLPSFHAYRELEDLEEEAAGGPQGGCAGSFWAAGSSCPGCSLPRALQNPPWRFWRESRRYWQDALSQSVGWSSCCAMRATGPARSAAPWT